MENNAKTRKPLDDDALEAVAGGVSKSVPAMPEVSSVYTPSGYYARHPEEDPDNVAPKVDSGGWTCTQCGATYSGPVTMKPDKCNCGGEWLRVL